MKYNTVPAFTAHELDIALRARFGNAFADFYGGDITHFFFDDDYHNDSFKRLWLDHYDIDEDADHDEVIHAWTYNLIIDFIVDMFPKGTKYILMDVSW
jgi:hypothetical protein